MVLHPTCKPTCVPPTRGFSPLLVGDGLASRGPVHTNGIESVCFSPLLVGDGLASGNPLVRRALRYERFSPLLVGDGLASRGGQLKWQCTTKVSVPFS